MKYFFWTVFASCCLFFVWLWTQYAPYENFSCTNTDTLFERYSPYDEQYNRHLKEMLDSHSKKMTGFWIEKYIEEGGRHLMLTEVKAQDLCAHCLFDITECRRMRHFISVKGMSYRGAGLTGLVYTIDSSEGHYRFILNNVDRIVD